MRRENLDVPPGKAHQVRLELSRRIPDCLGPLREGKQGQVKNTLADVRLPSMDKVRQIGNPDRIDLLTGEEDVQYRCHKLPMFNVQCSVVGSVIRLNIEH